MARNEPQQFFTKKTCRFCEGRIEDIDYKDVKLLQKFLATSGKIESRKRSGNCPRHQRKVTNAIKRARIMALLPFINR
jgi:small subunit ribosomal protein S18